MKSIVYVGMDVHKNSFSLCAMKGNSENIIAETKIAPYANLVKKFIDNLLRNYNDQDVEIITGYEAGCLGYSLYRQLEDLGIECEILAPSTMSKSAKNKVKKNDKMDAKNIATNLMNKSYKSVYVPDDADVEVKEYIRMISDFKESRKQFRQKILALLLRHGLNNCTGGSNWTAAHIKWLKELECSEMIRTILDEYLSELETLSEKIDRFAAKLEEISHREDYEEKISQLRCIKGIDTTAAMMLHVEISDFARFPTAAAFSAYCGLTPGENSSGDKSRRTSITKQGNTTVRSTLVECANALVKGTPGVKSKRIKARQKGNDVKVIDYADKATYRLQKKFHRLMYRGVNRNVAITAIARELACFVWGMETGRI